MRKITNRCEIPTEQKVIVVKREKLREREGDRERERISLFFLVVSLDVLWVKMFGMYNGSDEYRLVCLMMRQQVYIAKVCTCIKIERWLV